MAMKPEIKAQWIAALRSGEYAQGKGTLRSTENTYCCLGVLTDLAVKSGVGEWKSESGACVYQDGNDYSAAFLPESVNQWACEGGSDWDHISNAEIPYSLIDMNDGRSMSFDQIANAIETSDL